MTNLQKMIAKLIQINSTNLHIFTVSESEIKTLHLKQP